VRRDSRSGGDQRATDIRHKGFTDRVSLGAAINWLDAHPPNPAAEEIPVTAAAGRNLSRAVRAGEDVPPIDRAAADGYALRAADTVGAGDYNPLPLTRQALGAALSPGAAMAIVAGAALPSGADAIVPFEQAQATETAVEVFAAAAEGALVDRRGQELRAGTSLLEAGRILRPQDVALLALLGIDHVAVVRPPRLRLVIAGAKSLADGKTARDADATLLRALIARDGGTVESVILGASRRDAIREAIIASGADAVVVAGRSGAGEDDEATLALNSAGRLAIHGIAMRPGGSLGMGTVGDVPVLLLPGDPLACLCAYDLVAGRLVRHLAGRDRRLPYATREAEIGRKIVSAIGVADLCRVRLVDGRAELIASVETGGLASAVRADGFVLVPEPLEGYAPGVRVTVHLYDGWM
jgi:molybdopterin molybdotransferase